MLSVELNATIGMLSYILLGVVLISFDITIVV